MGIFDFLQPARDAISNFLINSGVTTPPNSTILLLLAALITSSFSGMVNRTLIDMEFNAALSVAGFGFWYFLSAIVLSTLLQRLLGINLTGMQNPMNQQQQQ